jgi:tetratricopeptide (TPR) repeat protein
MASCALITGASWLSAQKVSPKEAQAINAINAATTPDDKIKAIENVLTHFADTSFKPMLLQMAMQLEAQKGDYAQVVFYGERILEADPKNAFALVTLASETARKTREFDLDKEEKLAKVDKWAKDGIEDAKTMPKPQPQIPDDQWEGQRKDFQSQGYEALGMSAALRKKYDESVADYKQSIAVAANPDPGTWLRLGQTYIDAGKLDEATDAFDKGMNAPNASPQVKAIAQAKKGEVAKLKAAGAAKPAAAAPQAGGKQPQ